MYRDDLYVADLVRTGKGCRFRYTDEYLRSAGPAIALHLPKSEEGISVEGIANLPPYFAGLLPEGVMFSAVQRLIGSAADDIFAVLAATGVDAIGDVEVHIPGERSNTPRLDLDQAAELVALLLKQNRQSRSQRIPAIPGVQPKLSIGGLVRSGRKGTFIAKFEAPEFPGLIQNEHACMRLAARCRIPAAKTRPQPGALIVSRFDRVYEPSTKTIRKEHVEDMLQVMNLYPNSKYSMEFETLMRAIQSLRGPTSTLLEALQLYVFSYIIGNGDLHAKNLSLIQNKTDGSWRLAPAYDLLSTLPYSDVLPGADRMALALADESYGRFTTPEFVDFGERFGLPARAVAAMVHRVSAGVLKHLSILGEAELPEQVLETISGRAQSLHSE